jgi:hypothetical protein
VPIQLPDGTTKKIKLSTLLGVTPPPSADPLFGDVVLLMPMNTASGIADIKGKSTTNAGVSISTTILDPFGQNAGVVSFPGGGSRIEVAQSADFAFGSGAMAIEWWLHPTAFPGGNLWGMLDTRGVLGQTSWYLSANNTGIIHTQGISNFLGDESNAPSSIALDQWNYLCLSRDTTGSHKLWINGDLTYTSGSRNTSISAVGNLWIGDLLNSASPYDGSFIGYGSNLRITGAYRNGAIVPTTPFPTN